MLKRCLLGLLLPILFIGASISWSLPAYATSSPALLAGLDTTANNQFKASVDEVGGSEASGLPATIKNTINILLYVAGVIAVIIIVIGGIRFVTSEGDANSANKAKNSVVFAAVGLVLAVIAYAIVNLVLSNLT